MPGFSQLQTNLKKRKRAWEFAKQGASWSETEFTREFIVWEAQRTTPIFKAT